MHKIILKSGKSKPFWNKEPLVFSGAIAKIEGQPAAADLVALYDDGGYCIGYGVFNPHSLYRVRLLCFTQEQLTPDLNQILEYRLTQAIKKRQGLGLPSTDHTAYRLCNSEGDGLSGLTVDVFGSAIVVSSTAYWTEFYRDLIQQSLKKLLSPSDLVWRQQVKALAQDGWTTRDTLSPDSSLVVVKENGLSYWVDLGQGQKTGYYCDQRENRQVLRSVVRGKKVLDCFCYTGGFALNAKAAGARAVVGVDSSEAAIKIAVQNAELNQLASVHFEEQDVLDFLLKEEGFDCIVLDPPKLAPNQKTMGRAKQYYLKLNTLALSKLKAGAYLMTFSCSDAMTPEFFLSLVKLAAEKAHQSIKVIQTLSAGPDHPFLAKSQYGNYLKGLLVQIK